MTLTDYVLDIALIAVVVFQVRGRRLTARSLLLPVAIVVYAAARFLHSVPTTGNDVAFAAVCTAAGIALGTGAGLATRVTRGADGLPYARAGVVAAALWVVGVGCRLAFQLYATHGGGPAIARFSAAHHLTLPGAWVAAIILMALAEALARTAVLAVRAYGPAMMVTGVRRPA
jgi:hypothetical protein